MFAQLGADVDHVFVDRQDGSKITGASQVTHGFADFFEIVDLVDAEALVDASGPGLVVDLLGGDQHNVATLPSQFFQKLPTLIKTGDAQYRHVEILRR